MDTATLIQFGILLVAIIGVVASYALMWRQLRIQLLHSISNEQRELHFKLLELILAETNETNNKGDSKKEDNARCDVFVAEYLNYMENLALLINEKYVEERIARKLFYQLVIKDTPVSFGEAIEKGNYTQYKLLRDRWSVPPQQLNEAIMRWVFFIVVVAVLVFEVLSYMHIQIKFTWG